MYLFVQKNFLLNENDFLFDEKVNSSNQVKVPPGAPKDEKMLFIAIRELNCAKMNDKELEIWRDLPPYFRMNCIIFAFFNKPIITTTFL